MKGGGRPVKATFWLLEAPDSLAEQSRREPDGTGIGWFDAGGRPHVDKQPIAAYEDEQFAREARELESPTFIAHVRYATTGGLEAKNTHPFEQRGRLFAHNGVIGDLDRLERELGDEMALVGGDTDSERFFALITREIARCGDVTQGIVAAARWVASELPVYAINLVLTTADGLWALRYPDAHQLWILQRAAGGARGTRHLDAASAAGRVRVRSADLAMQPCVIVASEPMDEDPGWRLLESGVLVRAGPTLEVESMRALAEPPAHRLAR
jgi:predicted glutamine amidotransferase